jgi:glycosyltransferase involved in cell wall biosynthesis
MPIVSVVIPTYRRPQFLRIALASVRDQSFKDIEIVVHDDGSPEDVAAAVAAFPELPIRFYRSERSLGQTANVIGAMRRATGKYLALLADDDRWKPEFLARMVAALEEKPECVLAFSNYEIIDDEGAVQPITRKIQRYHGNHLVAPGYHRSFERIATIFRAVTVISGCLLRRGATDWTDVPAGLSMGIDTYIGFLAARLGLMCYFDAEPLIQIRYHRGTLTSAANTDVKEVIRKHQAFFVLWERVLNDPAMRHKRYYLMKRWWYAWALAVDHLRLHEWEAAIRQLASLRCLDLRVPLYFLGYLVQFKLMGLDRRLVP